MIFFSFYFYLEYEEINNEPKKENKNQTFQKQSDFSLVIDKFFQKFVGLKEDMSKELEKIEHDKNKPRSTKEEKKTFNKCAFSINLLSNVIFIVFFFFTMLSLINMIPTNQTFAMRETLFNQFGSPSEYPYLDRYLILGDIISRLKDLFLDPVILRPRSQEINSQATPIRISFYATKQKETCPGNNFNGRTKCYDAIFGSTTAVTEISGVKMNSGHCK
jgi:hypothetical protein